MRAYGVANTTLGNEHVMMRRKIVSALMEFTINNMQGTGKKNKNTYFYERMSDSDK